MEAACTQENMSQFSQSNATPFMVPPLLDDFEFMVDTPAAEEALIGSYVPPAGTDHYAAILLEQLARPASIAATGLVETYILTNKHQSAWQKQKERTLSKSNSLSFSHYKAASNDRLLSDFDATMQYSLRDWLCSQRLVCDH